MADAAAVPVLWHLKVSPYNEKVRWALDHKNISHVRRAAEPGRHRAIAQRLTGGKTFPVLEIDGRAIGDSTQIIAELERRHPEPPLYPDDPDEQRRALEIEDFFDEELGPHLRLLVLRHVLVSPTLTFGMFFPDATRSRRAVARATFPLQRRRAHAAFGIDKASVERAWAKVFAAGERFRTELQPNGYLVGSGFTIADLATAAIVAPVVAPKQFPYPQPQREHPLFAPLREALAAPGLLDWALEMYSRHRGPSAEITPVERLRPAASVSSQPTQTTPT
jgi:glutathione S-transferase